MRKIKVALGTALVPEKQWEYLIKKFSREAIRDIIVSEGIAALSEKYLDNREDDITLDDDLSPSVEDAWHWHAGQ